MEDELISVIVPVYNVENYIIECLESIIHQTYKNLEIILIDDGSTDNSGKVCDEYARKDDRIQVIHKKNNGLSSARNKGLDNSKGKYVQFIDSDDYIERDTIESVYKIAKQYDADIVTFSHYVLNNNNKICNCSKIIKEINSIDAIKEIMLDDKIRNYTWEKLWKKELFNEIRFPEGKKFEDLLTSPLIFEKANKIVLYDFPKYYYRQRSDSIMGRQSKELRIEYIQAVCKMNEYLKDKYPEIIKFLNYNIVNMTLNTYNDIAVFGMYELLEEDIVKEIYNMSYEIINNEENEQFIKEKSSEVKQKHIELLMSNKLEYYIKHLELPVIYPEHIGKEKKIKINFLENMKIV